jgi:alanyl-tRNA synthetase
MQQHTGEHILSGIFLARFGAQNVGFHLTPNSCQIDVTLSMLDSDQVQTIEDDANRVIFSNLPITARFYAENEMSGLALRKEPGKEFEEVRLVSIENCDCCPCGGTHVSYTGEAGLIKIRSWEKRKTNLRIDFVTGGRALADFRLKHDVVRNLSAKLSTPPEGVVIAYEKQCDRLDLLTRQLSALRKEYHAMLADQLLAGTSSIKGTRIVTHVFSGYSSAELSDFSGRIASHGDTIALLAGISPEDNRSTFLFSAASPAAIPMQDLLREVLLPSGGKGGGNATQAQGGTPTVNAEEILAAASDLLTRRLQS